MFKKTKFYKAIISVIALFFFVKWGLDPNVICRVASETPQVCGYSEHGVVMNAFGSGFAFILTAMAAAILTLWVRKD
ncbi:hypothetical protein ZH03_004637 [Salmonella enterica subsp. enterica]|uniref:Uncharacterized protein n=2 Tax=Salmonella enterica TaxID=28901 RepID=A0A734CG86_SALET|nr:hypothetical protein [Salmonella enterica]EAA5587851.1 hypothetical protein [Salmonella enterica subsp. enterica serovar Muenchen]EBG2392041.1 hypothetical protein [Salmonella enterica subsp. enterica serovar Cotham]EBV0857946.1 hypothetical protein [Salmonella enterica subsp. enterica serovar Anecho]EBV2360235.1 hypothetical protein [Salmonella enterica subsp. enterica serovar Ago]EBV2691425.1 hypothetical protein [Salmonella enterica subsp. enterica serovar Monschaui]EBX7568088.1 hypothe